MTNAESFEKSVNKSVDELVEIKNVNKSSKKRIVEILQNINEEILNYKIIADQ